MIRLICCAGLLWTAHVTSAAEPMARFSDVARSAQIGFRYTFGDFSYDNILESSGSGVTWLDYDGDGDQDLYLLNGTYLEDISDPKGRHFTGANNQLFRNNADGTFSEVAHQAGVDDRHWSMAAATVDWDSDGDTDIYLLNYGPNRFYRNNGDGTFSDITRDVDLSGPKTLNRFTKWSVSAAFWDCDQDGRLDVMVGNFLAFDPYYLSPATPDRMPHPAEYEGQPSLLYRQRSDGTFVDDTKRLELHYPQSKCMGLTLLDFDDDGLLDLFQGNDHQKNFLFRHLGRGRYREVGVQAGVVVNDQGFETGSMHGSIGDLDGDQQIDLLVTDLRHGAYYRNLGNGLFEDATESSGLKSAFEGKGAWAAVLLDMDNDGDLDIFSANGAAEVLVDQPQLLLENDGNGHFRDVGTQCSPYFLHDRSARGAAAADYDNDGDLDIAVSHIDLQGRPSLLRNDTRKSHHWVGLTLIGRTTASAVGARVSVQAGNKSQVALNQWGNSYLSFQDPRMHFGLGDAAEIRRLEVRWADGEVQHLSNLPVDRYLEIRQSK